MLLPSSIMLSKPATFPRHSTGICDSKARHLNLQSSPRLKSTEIPLNTYKRILIISFGKAALTMLNALIERLRKYPSAASAPRPVFRKRTWRIRYFEGGHPLPNEDSLEAARETLKLLKRARKNSFVFFLISGAVRPCSNCRSKPKSLSMTRLPFTELSSPPAQPSPKSTPSKILLRRERRKARDRRPRAEKLSLLLADVPLKDLGAVASSPTLPDLSTRRIVSPSWNAFSCWKISPERSRYFEQLMANPPAPNPAKKEAFAHSQFDTLLSNHDL